MTEQRTLKFLEPESKAADVQASTENAVPESESNQSRISRASRFSRVSRISRMFQSVSIRRSRRSTFVRPVLRYKPTYRLESKNPFDIYIVTDLLKVLVDSRMEARGKIKFDSKTSVNLCRELSDEILTLVKGKNYDRYRIIANVTAGEKFHQSFLQNAGFLWDSEKDSFANYVYENSDIFIISTVYGIYYD